MASFVIKVVFVYANLHLIVAIFNYITCWVVEGNNTISDEYIGKFKGVDKEIEKLQSWSAISNIYIV